MKYAYRSFLFKIAIFSGFGIRRFSSSFKVVSLLLEEFNGALTNWYILTRRKLNRIKHLSFISEVFSKKPNFELDKVFPHFGT